MRTFEFEGNRIAYRDEGRGPVVLFAHGTPSSSAEFVDVTSRLTNKSLVGSLSEGGGYRCISIDHLGFGGSDKPEVGDYSLTAHSRRMAALLDYLVIDRFHLVAHDFGGPIALAMALKRWDSVQSLTLMNTWAWPLMETEPTIKRQAPLLRSGLIRFLYRRFNLSAKLMVKAAWGSYRPLTADKHQEYQRPFASPSERSGTVAFLASLLDATDPAWQLHKELTSAPEKPTLLLWGADDPTVSLKTLDRWKSLLPNAKVVTLNHVGHFVADEAPELVADAIGQHLKSASGSGSQPAGVSLDRESKI